MDCHSPEELRYRIRVWAVTLIQNFEYKRKNREVNIYHAHDVPEKVKEKQLTRTPGDFNTSIHDTL